MSARFHLAIEVGDLDTAVAWYRDVIGCIGHEREEIESKTSLTEE